MSLQPQTSVSLSMAPHLWFHGGTLVLDDVPESAAAPDVFRWVKARWRCPAIYYAAVQPWLRDQAIADRVPRWQRLELAFADDRLPHDYQLEALAAWDAAGRRGSIVLPTGAGKTYVALHAIARVARSTLIIAPTIDLLHQWYSRLTDAFGPEIGVFYGLEKDLRPITVTTYHSAASYIGDFGDAFKLIVFDEVHHLPAPSWQEIALMAIAPLRLGLTATYPATLEVGNWRLEVRGTSNLQPPDPLESLIGPIVYSKSIDDLTGQQLAEYRTERIRVDLTAEERAAYDEAYALYTGYMRDHRLRESHGPYWWNEYTRQSAYDADARQAKVAERRLRRIVSQAQAKLDKLESLLKQHATDPVLIFTEHNQLAYRISRRHLIPAITHQTTARERKAILDGFRQGEFRTIVTSKVLNEGVDLPEAKVAIVLGGSASTREYVQRLGRILRKRENKTAVLYEVICRKTVEEGISQRRRRKVKYGS
jgi:superfamily II DNA or RNA helicase